MEPHPLQHLFDLDDDELRHRARLAHFRFQWHGLGDEQREHIRSRAREEGLDIAAIEREPNESDIDVMLVALSRSERRRQRALGLA